MGTEETWWSIMSVIDFNKKKEEKELGQWASGAAICLQCKHEFVVTAPTGTVNFECPECHTHKAVYKFHFAPPPDTLVRECQCGNQFFFLTPEGHLCINCGTYQRYD